jgi:Flp pilus assembly CpaF family ATPase
LDELVALNFISALAANFLEVSVAAGLNILVSGGTQEKVRSSIVGTKMPVPPDENVRWATFQVTSTLCCPTLGNACCANWTFDDSGRTPS